MPNLIKLCRLDEIPEGESKGFNIQGKSIIVIKYRGELYLYENNCPHRNIPLEWMPDQFLDFDKTFIQCATHGALFKIDSGECIAGPCTGDKLQPVQFTINDGMICLHYG